MKATDHGRIVKDLNARHKAEIEKIESYYKQELADLQAQYETLCAASNRQDERIVRLVAVLNIIKNDRRVPQEWFGPLLDAAIEDRQVERPEFPFGEFDNGAHWKGDDADSFSTVCPGCGIDHSAFEHDRDCPLFDEPISVSNEQENHD